MFRATAAAVHTAGAPLVGDGKPEDFCGPDPKVPCRLIWNISHSPEATRFIHSWQIDTWVNRLVAVVIILVVALIIRRIAHKMITRFTTRTAEGTVPEPVRERTRTVFDGSPALVSARRAQRAATLGSVLRSIASILIMGTALFSALGQVGLNLAPVLASASVIGVAVGFGAQNVVKDFLAGLFMLLEDQYGVGDIVDLGDATGTVEEVRLRTTRLRDVQGTVWHVPNGTIQRVANKSQQWARALLDVSVAYGTDVDKAERVIKATAEQLVDEPDYRDLILEPPEVWGVEHLTNEAIQIRLVIKTRPAEQFKVTRELRRRLIKAFDEGGIQVPNGQRTVWLKDESTDREQS